MPTEIFETDNPDKPNPAAPPADPPVSPNVPILRSLDIRVVALGSYLLLMIIVSVVAIANLLMAETDQDTVECIQRKMVPLCSDKPDEKRSANANTNSNSNSTTNAESTRSAAPPTPTSTASPSPTATPKLTKPTATATPPGNGGAGTTTETASPSPSPTATAKTSPTPSKQQFAHVSIPPKEYVYGVGVINADSYVVLIVIFAGMLGAVIRVNYSFYKHLGFGDFTFNWNWFYLLLPFFGSALALVIYFVIRGGFYSSSYGEGLTLNLFSFAALAALTGLFSENAIEKLRQVAVTLLADTPPKVRESKALVAAREKAKPEPPTP